MKWHKVADYPGHVDLVDVHKYFEQQGVVHRFTENNGRQELWLAEERLVDDAKAFLEAWEEGKIRLEKQSGESGAEPPRRPRRPRASGRAAFSNYPFTLAIMLLGVVGFAIVAFLPRDAWQGSLTFQPYRWTFMGPVPESPWAGLQRGELWRLITPTFLHFNLLHIVFNGLWIWEFGRRLEQYFSAPVYLAIFFATALGANVIQYFTSSGVPFGGLSGVVYGYLGVLFVAHRIAPSPILAVPPGIFGFMLIWLALGVFGVVDLFMPGPTAVGNGAHLGGLLFGLVMGYLLFSRDSRPRRRD